MEDRPGTKIAEQLLTRPGAATGGPQYNVLRRLEGRGYRIRKVKEGKATRYYARPPASPSYTATLTSKGQVTVPQEVREQLRLANGQELKFTVEGDRAVITPLYRRLSELVGILPKPKRT